MAKQNTNARSTANRQSVTVRIEAPGGSKIKFGSVTISGAKPSAAAVKANVERSAKALERVTKSLLKPGVVIRAKKNVPQYAVAEGETGVFVRRLNGRTEHGRLVNGKFRVKIG
jgi:hypothetical protein